MENNSIVQPTFEQLPKAVSEINAKMDFILQELRTLGANKQDSLPDMITLEECASFLGKTTSTLYTMTSKGTIPYHKGGNKLYFFKNEIIEWLKKDNEPTSSTGETIEERAQAIVASKKRKPTSVIEQEKKAEEAQIAIERAKEAEAIRTANDQTSLPLFAIKCEKHTKTNADIYLMKFENTLTADHRNIVEPSVKAHGGYWSGMWSGYLFNDASSAHQCADAIRQKKGKENEEQRVAD